MDIVLLSKEGQSFPMPVEHTKYSLVIKEFTTSTQGVPMATGVTSAHIQDILLFMDLSSSELPAAEARLAAAQVNLEVTTAESDAVDEPYRAAHTALEGQRVRMVSADNMKNSIAVAMGVVRELHRTASDVNDIDGVSELMNALYIFDDWKGMVQTHSDTLFDEICQVRGIIFAAILSPSRKSVLEPVKEALYTLNKSYKTRAAALDEEHALEMGKFETQSSETNRLSEVSRQASALMRAARDECVEAEAALRTLRMDLQLTPSAAIRNIVESKSLKDVLMLAQAADFLAVGRLLDLCALAMAVFCAGKPQLLDTIIRDITHAINAPTPDQIPEVAWNARETLTRWPIAIDAVCRDETIDTDVRAGLMAVSHRLSHNMEPRRLASV